MPTRGWYIRCPEDKKRNVEQLQHSFQSLRGRIPGLRHIEIGVDHSRVSYSCDVVLYSEVDSQAALDAYAEHPEHMRVKAELQNIRIARHQVDYHVPAADKSQAP
ncbi:Dabb family protein [Pseudacidovorax sp. 1753]|uniref:Dabb family protein n=1 Tax=Pseudacidovorax sp. 1753 TaxID=3156419 RepID=UPI003393DB0D